MATQVIVLNGGSSSGKTGVARCLKAILPQPWIHFGIDDLLEALPPSLMGQGSGIEFGAQGEVQVGEGFREIESAWLTGLAAMARAGARVIIDDVFLDGGRSQERLRPHLDGLEVLWVGVHCDPEIVMGREIARGDRMPSAWRRCRRRSCTRASPTTLRSIPATPNRWSAPAPSPST